MRDGIGIPRSFGVADKQGRSPVAAILVAACGLMMGGCRADQPLPESRYPIALSAIPIQYNDNVQDSFGVSASQWSEITALFGKVSGGADERQAIALTVARLEQIAGEQTPVSNDRRKNQNDAPGATDCLDESTNTTTFLRLMREQNLLRYNRVMEKALRGPFQFDIHWTAVVQDLRTGEKWVIDSWYNANGVPPIVQPLDDWMKKKQVPGYYAEDVK